MDGENMRSGQQESPTQNAVASSKKKVWFVVIAVAAVILVLACIFAWFGYFSQEAREDRELQAKANRAQAALDEFEEAMRNDTYGGATPEETLQLFIAALEAGDIELASKYFALEDNMNDPDYLTRRKWEEGLRSTQQEGKIQIIISDLKEVRLESVNNFMETAWFSVRDVNGEMQHEILLGFNKSSGVWKIESL